METKNLDELDYELETSRIISEIKKQKAKKVLIQLPEGLKPYATQIVEEVKKALGSYNVEIFIWLDSCFGACDVPIETERLGIDMIVQFGHSTWNFKTSGNSNKIKIL